MNKRTFNKRKGHQALRLMTLPNLVLLARAPDASILTQHLVSKSKLTATSGVVYASLRHGWAISVTPVALRSNTEGENWYNGTSLCALLYRLYMALKVQTSEANCFN